MTDWLRGGLVECSFGIVARLELAKPFTQFGHAELSVHAGRLDRRIAQKMTAPEPLCTKRSSTISSPE